MPVNVKLPHLRITPEPEEPFVSVEREMAKMYAQTHPHYGEADMFGNKAPEAMTGSSTMTTMKDLEGREDSK